MFRHDHRAVASGARVSISCIKRGLSTRKSQAFSVLIAVALAMKPQFAEAGPCSHDIAALETGVRRFGRNPP
jgi:hypothetical protein